MTTYTRRSALALAAMAALAGLSSCSSSSDSSTSGSDMASDVIKTDAEKKIVGVAVYDVTDAEVVMFNKYLQEYIAGTCFSDIQFVYSNSLNNSDEAVAFIEEIGELGGKGIMSFYGQDLEAEVDACAKYSMYHLIASGTVDDASFSAVKRSQYFLGTFGPGNTQEQSAGSDMAKHFIGLNGGKRYFIMTGGAAYGNNMHIQRVNGIVSALEQAYGVTLGADSLASASEPTTKTVGDVTVTVCPGYGNVESMREVLSAALKAQDFDYLLSVLPVTPIIDAVPSNVLMGAVDCYSQNNQLLFNEDRMVYVTGKYGSQLGCAAAAMYNAVTGYATDFRDNGNAFQITQAFWSSNSKDDFNEKYEYASNVTIVAYNYEDIQSVCKAYNASATLSDLRKLAEACSYEDAKKRRAGA